MQSSIILSSSADKGATVSGESRLAGKDTVYLSFSKTRQLGGGGGGGEFIFLN